MTVEDYQTISNSIDSIDSDAELLECLGFLQQLSMLAVNKLFHNLPKRRFRTKGKKGKKMILTKKREAWYKLSNYYNSLKAHVTLYKNG